MPQFTLFHEQKWLSGTSFSTRNWSFYCLFLFFIFIFIFFIRWVPNIDFKHLEMPHERRQDWNDTLGENDWTSYCLFFKSDKKHMNSHYIIKLIQVLLFIPSPSHSSPSFCYLLTWFLNSCLLYTSDAADEERLV